MPAWCSSRPCGPDLTRRRSEPCGAGAIFRSSRGGRQLPSRRAASRRIRSCAPKCRQLPHPARCRHSSRRWASGSGPSSSREISRAAPLQSRTLPKILPLHTRSRCRRIAELVRSGSPSTRGADVPRRIGATRGSSRSRRRQTYRPVTARVMRAGVRWRSRGEAPRSAKGEGGQREQGQRGLARPKGPGSTLGQEWAEPKQRPSLDPFPTRRPSLDPFPTLPKIEPGPFSFQDRAWTLFLLDSWSSVGGARNKDRAWPLSVPFCSSVTKTEPGPFSYFS